ncbi:MAG: M48 family metalloprotease [Bryobacteraceae bacterium]
MRRYFLAVACCGALLAQEKEQALGHAMAVDLRRQNRIVDDDLLAGYLRTMVTRLDAVARSPFPLTVEILGSAKPRSEPVAFPGGYLFVSLGMIAAAESEAELAGALAHGLAHIAARHGTRSAWQGQREGISPIPLIFVGGWANPDDEGQVLIPAGSREHQRRYEEEADRLAAEWMARVGYPPSAWAAYLGRMRPASLQPLSERVAAIARVAGPKSESAHGMFAAAKARARELLGPGPAAKRPSLQRAPL